MTNSRASLVMLHNAKIGIVHFTSTALQKDDAWMPVERPLFESVEGLMVANGIALNVTSIEKLRSCGDCDDYLVVYNKA